MSDGEVTVDRFARLVVEISQLVTVDELSQMKLHLRASGMMGIIDVDDVGHAADLIRTLIDRNKISRSNIGVLVELLHVVKRNDLVRRILLYINLPPSRATGSNGMRFTDGYGPTVKTFFETVCSDYGLADEFGNFHGSQMSVDVTDEEKARGMRKEQEDDASSQEDCTSSQEDCTSSQEDSCPNSQNSHMSVDDPGPDLADVIPLSGRSITDEQKLVIH